MDKLLQSTYFGVKEVPVMYDTPDGDIDSGHKLIVREDNHAIISCVTDKYRLLKNEQVMETMLPALNGVGAILKEAVVHSNARTTWKFRIPDIKIKVTKGDYLNPEIIIKNSYDGTCEVNALAGAFRLICTNGMIIGHIFGKSGIRHTIWNKPERIKEIIDEVVLKSKNAFVDEFPLLVETKIDKMHLLELVKLFPTHTMDDMVKYLLKDNPKTYWDLLNAATWIATHIMNRKREATHKLEAKIYPTIKKLASQVAQA
mgnify:FL=1